MNNLYIVAIVVTYNGSKWIEKCLGSLTSCSIPLKIFAIDNASTDHTVSLIKNQFPGVEVIETGANIGFGQANNIGLKKALELNADYVFLLNQDAWVEKDTIEQLVRVADANKEYGVISPFHLLPGQNKLEWYFSTYIAPEKCKDLVSDIYFKQTKSVYALEFVNAAAWLISKECLEQVGGFDPLFPHYGEDEDYCSRVLYKKLKVGVTPEAIIYHDITMKTWDEIKFNPQRQLIFAFIELKNIRISYHFLLFNYYKNLTGKLFSLLVLRKWRELWLMTKIFFRSLGYLSKINRSRKVSKQYCSYLK
ncbi:MAG: glycosyltransferase family 2 protein [Bacteroidota bacterium]|nr:glycosyltransferase family 2 protein [Bacteroidota bacterium]